MVGIPGGLVASLGVWWHPWWSSVGILEGAALIIDQHKPPLSEEQPIVSPLLSFSCLHCDQLCLDTADHVVKSLRQRLFTYIGVARCQTDTLQQRSPRCAPLGARIGSES